MNPAAQPVKKPSWTAKAPFMLALFWLALASGCTAKYTLDTPVSSPSPAGAKAVAQQKAQAFKDKQKADLPDTLGGVVSSERWIIYKEKEEEEFEGNVRYDNGIYAFRADYALSQRKKNLFTARGNVWARYNPAEGGSYEIYADKATYNYKTADGTANGTGKKQMKLVYHDPKGDVVTALADQTHFNTQEQTYRLSGNVLITHQDPHGKLATLKGQELTVLQQKPYALLQGGAEAENPSYHLKAQTIEYNGEKGFSYAYGGRPLIQGKTEDGTFAIIADEIKVENTTRKIHLTGQVQGWTVSEQINRSQANQSF